MDVALSDDMTILIADCHSPFVPHSCGRMVPPDRNSHFLAPPGKHRVLYREVEREPTMHARCVCFELNRVENFLIDLCGEITGESMDLSLFFDHFKVHLSVVSQLRGFVLVEG